MIDTPQIAETKARLYAVGPQSTTKESEYQTELYRPLLG
jgi:hypothetical protein